jgi:hypothetical protein
MRRLTIPAVVIALLFLSPGGSFISAQQATINTPVAPPADAKIIVSRLEMTRNPPRAVVDVSYQDAGSSETKRVNFFIPQDQNNPGTELQDFASALGSTRSGETGTATRKLNFRALGYLVDSGRLSGVTLVP